jgi:hypothetical protein
MNKLFGPVYSISANLKRAAEECNTGIDTFEMTLPTIAASLSVHVPDSQRGNKMPLKNADGL